MYSRIPQMQMKPKMEVCLFCDCYRTARNPYDPTKIAGGSSSGSAAVVSAGLCPVALGVDGGGKICHPSLKKPPNVVQKIKYNVLTKSYLAVE